MEILQMRNPWPKAGEIFVLGRIPFIYTTIHPRIWQMFIKPVLGQETRLRV